MQNWSENIDDFFLNFCAEEIKTLYLINAITLFNNFLDQKYPGKKSSMNPGSLIDWDVAEQQKIFQLLKDAPYKDSITINESSLIYPEKSLSGITYFSEVTFENCMLCPREKCFGRRARFKG